MTKNQPPPDETREETRPVNAQTAAGADQPSADQSGLLADLHAAQNAAAENLDGWQRARAEFANYKKRVEREQLNTYQRAAGDIIVRYLSVLDDLNRALEDKPTSGDSARWAEGVEMIARKLKAIIDAENIQPLASCGDLFDPGIHEAVSQEESETYAENQIIGIVQQGYRLGERVLRPAMVRVAR